MPEDEVEASFHYSNHDLREMFSRDNAERRRSSGKMLRGHLDAKQDKTVMNKMVRIRDEYEVSNSDDVIIVWAQTMVEAGTAEGIAPEILAAAKATVIPKRATPLSEA